MHTVRSPRILLGALLIACAALTLPVSAHHGWGGYNEAQPFELNGTLETAVSLAGPHATMRVRANGQVWDVVLAGRIAETALDRFSDAGSTFSPLVFKLQSVSA